MKILLYFHVLSYVHSFILLFFDYQNNNHIFAFDYISAIHDHAGAHCLMKVLDGQLVETQFKNPDYPNNPSPYCVGSMISTKVTNFECNQVAYIHGN